MLKSKCIYFLDFVSIVRNSRVPYTYTVTHSPSSVMRRFRNGRAAFSPQRWFFVGLFLCSCVFIAAQGAASRRSPGRTGARDLDHMATAVMCTLPQPRDLVQ